MAKEIERKFLVTGTYYRQFHSTYYRQGYLSTSPDATVRVRIAGDKAFITVKGRNNGVTRLEFEYEICVADANEMLDNLVKTGIIEKRRYTGTACGKTWEVDEFMGLNDGLVVAEVELTDANENIELPSWIGKEVSSDHRYYNSSLADNPYTNWK